VAIGERDGDAPLIAFEHVSFAYRSDRPAVLHEVSFEVAARAVTAIVGPSGGESASAAATSAADRATPCALRSSYVEQEAPVLTGTEIAYRGSTLSGGVRQRIAIARALLRRPALLLLEEAASQLDAVNELALRETLGRVSERCAVLAIAHRLSTVLSARRIVVLEDCHVRAGRHAPRAGPGRRSLRRAGGHPVHGGLILIARPPL
jgi:ABC-type multidrug transport system fused ATPase/permease subunit